MVSWLTSRFLECCRLLRETFEPELLTTESRFASSGNNAVVEVRHQYITLKLVVSACIFC